ncbi:MAG: hypothetical protein ACOH2T_29390 [Pseudomonas sp.]
MMVSPADITKSILDAGFAEGRLVAEIFYRYAPGELGPEYLEDVQDRVVEVASRPFEQDPKFANQALLNGIKVSIWSGFETRWRELVHEALGRPRV